MQKIIRADRVQNEESVNFKELNRMEHSTYNRTMEGKVYWSRFP